MWDYTTIDRKIWTMRPTDAGQSVGPIAAGLSRSSFTTRRKTFYLAEALEYNHQLAASDRNQAGGNLRANRSDGQLPLVPDGERVGVKPAALPFLAWQMGLRCREAPKIFP